MWGNAGVRSNAQANVAESQREGSRGRPKGAGGLGPVCGVVPKPLEYLWNVECSSRVPWAASDGTAGILANANRKSALRSALAVDTRTLTHTHGFLRVLEDTLPDYFLGPSSRLLAPSGSLQPPFAPGCTYI
ncbi:hypothetical protein SAMN06296065_102472 [Novosphingobium panipatense]|uniref:Uncharacterized protein n=1 Tax=Novosphingobium panipatense TaxID=428991 RepID=A0ABY1Q3Q4_9SPHN|nr:hypothetical protein SAMN06296065_102472 [Novosphingobium panipatense]